MISSPGRQFRRYEPKLVKERYYANAVRSKQETDSSDGDLIQKNQGVQPQQYYVNHRKRTAWSTAVRYGYHIKSLMSAAMSSQLVSGASGLPIGTGRPIPKAMHRWVTLGYSSGDNDRAPAGTRDQYAGAAPISAAACPMISAAVVCEMRPMFNMTWYNVGSFALARKNLR